VSERLTILVHNCGECAAVEPFAMSDFYRRNQ